MGGSFNTFLGGSVGYKNQSGNCNIFLGQNAGGANLTATGNTYVGSRAGVENETDELNVASGYLAAAKNKTGSYNVAYGTTASYSNVAGNSNAAFGHNAGYNSRGATTRSLVLMRMSWSETGNPLILNNATAIGANAKVSVSNALVLGDSVAGTKVGIGVTTPMFALGQCHSIRVPFTYLARNSI